MSGVERNRNTKNKVKELASFSPNRCMDGVTALTTQRGRIVNDAKLVTMTHHGGLLVRMIHLNARVSTFSMKLHS